MTLDRLGRWRLPAIAVAALAIALAAVAVILLLPSLLGTPDKSPTPTTTEQPSATEAVGDTPEAAVRAFFEAFAEARETSDPSVIEPFVNGTESSAYLTAAAFLDGQAEQGKGSITTVNELTDFDVTETDDTAVVQFTYLAGGYNIDLETGEPLESPEVLDPSRVRAEVVRVNGQWLVDSYEEDVE
jgi:hypothetical protein